MERTAEHVDHDDRNPLLVWAHAQYAIWDRWLGNLGSGVGSRPASLWSRATGGVDEALSASAKATFFAQALMARSWAERVASDPRSSKVVVEGAHQMYELVTACTEAKAEYCTAWLAALRSIDPEQLARPWFAAWRAPIRKELDESGAVTPRKELMPPNSESR